MSNEASDINPTTFALGNIERRLTELEKGQVLSRLSALESNVTTMQSTVLTTQQKVDDLTVSQQNIDKKIDDAAAKAAQAAVKSDESKGKSNQTLIAQVITGLGGLAYVILKSHGLVP